MRILIDFQGAQTESRFRGIGRYSLALVEAIIQNAKQHEIWILLNGDMQDSCSALQAMFSKHIPGNHFIIFYPPKKANNQFNRWLRRAAELIREHFIKAIAPDILYITSLFEGASNDNAVLSIGLLETSYLTTANFYDLIPLLNAENYLAEPNFKEWYMEKVEYLKRADLLLSISEYSKQEVEQALLIDSTKVINISSACNDFFKPIKVDEVCKKLLFDRLGFSGPFIMTNSAFEHRKNIDRLIEAFSHLEKSLLQSYQLVLTGKVSDYDKYRLIDLAKSFGIAQNVFFTGYLEDDELLILFNCAYLFVFPSMHEGFGLPALEAMACGTATIGSNKTSIPEVIGLADALFDPFDVDSIKNKMTEVLTCEDFRQKLIRHGLIQAKVFSWGLTAKRTIDAFEELFHKRKSSLTINPDPENVRKWYQTQIEVILSMPENMGEPSDLDLKLLARSIVQNQKQLNRLFNGSVLPKKIRWRVEGPFDTSYSLALLNRETSLALSALGHEVYLHPTEGPGDFEPQSNFLENNPKVAKFYKASKLQYSCDADVVSRNLYPPRVNDMDSKMNLLHHYAWEESGFPQDWAADFNAHLQGITCLSRHVHKIMVDNGVMVPMTVTGCGVDHWDRMIADPSYKIKAKPFRFLHVSSCFPRKGADVLLKAFGQAFSDNDPVTLVIKTFANPHNEIHLWLAAIQKEYTNYPDVLIIEEDLSDGQLKSLYMQCDVMVAPSRAEGFGLPMAEAILSGMPVITTAWGGQLDFCNEKTSWLVDYEFKLSYSHLELFNSVWAEPNIQRLSQAMVKLYRLPNVITAQKVKAGQKLLRERFTWTQVTERLVDATRDWAASAGAVTAQNRIAWVTTWNTPCGIATYSEHLISQMPEHVMIFAAKTEHMNESDGHNVRRCWQSGLADSLEELSIALDEEAPDCVVIQFNYGLFKLATLEELLLSQLDQGRVIVLMMHSTLDPVDLMPDQRLYRIRKTLARCHRVLVHSLVDLNRLKALGLVSQVSLFPHGILDFHKKYDAEMYLNNPNMERTIVLASYGFFLPHKGLLELIEVVGRLIEIGYQVNLKMINSEYPNKDSAELIIRAKKMIESLKLKDHIEMVTDYLTDEQSTRLLQTADVLIYPYQRTGESASGAVRYGLALGKPVMVTPLTIFDDVTEVVYQLPGLGVDEIEAGVIQMLDEIKGGSKRLNIKRSKLLRWKQQHSYGILGKRLSNILNVLIHNEID
jgi:glycosyltransferase involved in cell wall biosynthesis